MNKNSAKAWHRTLEIDLPIFSYYWLRFGLRITLLRGKRAAFMPVKLYLFLAFGDDAAKGQLSAIKIKCNIVFLCHSCHRTGLWVWCLYLNPK